MNMIRQIACNFLRHPRQLNGILEADAEILQLPDGRYLVTKTDGIYEEIHTGLYNDPYLIGWMAVTAPVSDIAAVAARPSGILLSLVLPPQPAVEWLTELQRGINDACARYDCYVLGGDTNFGESFSVSATVIAHIQEHVPLLRSGSKAGDFVFSSGKLGSGNAYAYKQLVDKSANVKYKPTARLEYVSLLRKYATTCIDSSDGLFPALSVLSIINNKGFQLGTELKELMCEDAINIQHHSGLPAWMFLAGPHGEYEFVFSISPERKNNFLNDAAAQSLTPILIAEVTNSISTDFIIDEKRIQCEPAFIPNLFQQAGGDIQRYIQLMREQHKKWTV